MRKLDKEEMSKTLLDEAKVLRDGLISPALDTQRELTEEDFDKLILFWKR